MREDGQGTHPTTARPAIASQLHRVLEDIPAAAYTCDAEGRITYFARRASDIWGRQQTLNDPLERYCGAFKLFTANGSPVAHDRCWMAMALRDQYAIQEQEIIIERPDGSRITVLANVNLLTARASPLAWTTCSKVGKTFSSWSIRAIHLKRTAGSWCE